MTFTNIQPEQRTAAKIVGFLYVITMATSVFGYMVQGRLLVPGNAVTSARNIVAQETLYRLSVVGDLLTVVGVVVLLWALWSVLDPVNRRLALLAAFLRLMENAVAAASLIESFLALRLLSDTPYLRAFEPEQLQVLGRVLIGGHGAGLNIAFIFLGFGSTVFSLLWLRSGYIPRAIAWLGIFSSLALAIVGMTIMVFPRLSFLGISYMLPLGLYEVGLGFWLLFRGLATPNPQR